MNDIELIDEIVKRAEEHQKQREKEFAISELEKLKAEVQGLCHTERDTFDKVVRLDKLNNAIDTRIKELKGEDKEKPFDRTDDCLSYEESFCEARDCGECCYRE